MGHLLAQKRITAEPIVYEDFLPKSAAGLFQSNLTSDGRKDDSQTVTEIDAACMEGTLGATQHDPNDLYNTIRARSLAAVAENLGISGRSPTPPPQPKTPGMSTTVTDTISLPTTEQLRDLARVSVRAAESILHP